MDPKYFFHDNVILRDVVVFGTNFSKKCQKFVITCKWSVLHALRVSLKGCHHPESMCWAQIWRVDFCFDFIMCGRAILAYNMAYSIKITQT